MKILYLHQHFSTPRGAVGIRSYEMAKQLIARGHEVTMVCGSFQGGHTGLISAFSKGRRSGKTEDGITVIEFDLTYANADSFLKRSCTFLRFAILSIAVALSRDYDLIFATTTPLTAGIPGIFSRWFRGKPFVFEVRDLWPELPRAMGVIKSPAILGMLSALEWLTYHSARHLIGLSPGIVEGIANRGIERGRIAMIPNGCDLDIFDNASLPWRPSDVGDQDFVAIFSGTHGRANGLQALINVAKELKARGRSDIKILLIGQGALKGSLQSQVASENLDNVIFHPPVDKARLAGLLASADIGLQILANVPAFYYGTSPNKFFDYLASGLAVLTNYPGWIADLVEEHKCGIAVPPDDYRSFADALEQAADNRDAVAQMGQQALLLATVQFERKHLANNFVDWLEQSIKG